VDIWRNGREISPDYTSIVIPVYDQLEHTRACLDSLDEHTRAPWRLIVVDNGSSDGTGEYLAERAAEWDHMTVITNDENAGFTLAVNQGMEAADGRYVVLLNNDTTVTPGWLTGLVMLAESDDRIGLVGPKILHPETGQIRTIGGLVFHMGGKVSPPPGQDQDADDPRFAEPFECQYVEGSCMLVKRAVIDEIGVLDEVFAPAYYEDTDYCFRAREAGFRIVYSPYSEIYHHSTVTAQVVNAEDPSYAAAARRNDRIFKARWAHRFW